MAVLALASTVVLMCGCSSTSQNEENKAKEEAKAAKAELEKVKAAAEKAEAELATVKSEVEKLRRPKLVQKRIEGTFTSIPGTKGVQAFGVKFADPPNVIWTAQSNPMQAQISGNTVIVKITCEGFEWEADKGGKSGTVYWAATGTVMP
jgi:hypothetical protein